MTDQDIRDWDTWSPKDMLTRARLIAEYHKRKFGIDATPEELVVLADGDWAPMLNEYSAAQHYFNEIGLLP